MSDTLFLHVAQVKLGLLEIEGLMSESGKYFIGFPQIQALNLVPPNRSLKQLESLLGMSFSSHQKAKTKLNSKAINVIELTELEKLIAKSDRLGNVHAQKLRDDLVGLSLHQLFSDAFKIKFDAEDRQDYLVNRQLGKITRRSMTDAIKDWCIKNEKPEKVQGYIVYCSDTLNIHLFSKKSSELKELKEVPKNAALRDYFTALELYQIDKIEDKVTELVDLDNLKPTDAIKLVIARQVQHGRK